MWNFFSIRNKACSLHGTNQAFKSSSHRTYSLLVYYQSANLPVCPGTWNFEKPRMPYKSSFSYLAKSNFAKTLIPSKLANLVKLVKRNFQKTSIHWIPIGTKSDCRYEPSTHNFSCRHLNSSQLSNKDSCYSFIQSCAIHVDCGANW